MKKMIPIVVFAGIISVTNNEIQAPEVSWITADDDTK